MKTAEFLVGVLVGMTIGGIGLLYMAHLVIRHTKAILKDIIEAVSR